MLQNFALLITVIFNIQGFLIEIFFGFDNVLSHEEFGKNNTPNVNYLSLSDKK
jgi:hypothetical protein